MKWDKVFNPVSSMYVCVHMNIYVYMCICLHFYLFVNLHIHVAQTLLVAMHYY